MLKMPMIMPYEELSKHFEETLTNPAHAIDWVMRLPSRAIVNTGMLTPAANSSVVIPT